jgi:hypothetical protein
MHVSESDHYFEHTILRNPSAIIRRAINEEYQDIRKSMGSRSEQQDISKDVFQL